MKKYVIIFNSLLLLSLLSPAAASPADFRQTYAKVIFIDQHRQTGAAYEDGRKILEFPVMTGDDETTTNPGTYLVRMKDDSYYSRKYQTWMPYSLFFDMSNRKAIHEGEVPPPAERKEYATHGCIHVESPYIEKLFDWAEENQTVVEIKGWRDGD